MKRIDSNLDGTAWGRAPARNPSDRCLNHNSVNAGSKALGTFLTVGILAGSLSLAVAGTLRDKKIKEEKARVVNQVNI